MTVLIRLILILLATFGLFAQTTQVRTSQAKGLPSANGEIPVVLPNGFVGQASLGANLKLTISTDPAVKPILEAIVVAPPTTSTDVIDEIPSQDPVNTLSYALSAVPLSGSLRCYRNGLRQRPTKDYTLSGQTISFVTAYSNDPTAYVTCDYKK